MNIRLSLRHSTENSFPPSLSSLKCIDCTPSNLLLIMYIVDDHGQFALCHILPLHLDITMECYTDSRVLRRSFQDMINRVCNILD